MRSFLTTLPLCCTIAVASGQSTLTMRGGAETPEGKIVHVDAQGVKIEGAGGERVVGWDRVRLVSGDLEPQFARFASIADKAWRARARLERGDVVMAEPLLEELATKVGSEVGPTSRLVFAGLVRCRLARGAVIAAAPAFLAWHKATGGDAEFVSEVAWGLAGPTDVGLIDARTLLAPGLPPIWVGSPALQSLARQEWPKTPLGILYEQAARFEAGLSTGMPRRVTSHRSDSERAGYDLVYAVVASRIGEEQERRSAREELVKDIDTQPEWARAWRWAAVGRSLLREQDAESRWRGVAELLRVPAEVEHVTPYVTGLAMGEAAAALRELGDSRGAALLADEIVERFPGHPVLDWQGVRGIQRPAQSGSAQGGST